MTRVGPSLALALALVAAALPRVLMADVEVMVPGGSRIILARSGDPLEGGGSLRSGMDRIFWLPTATHQGYLFINHELVFPNGGLSRLRYEDGVITERRNWVTGRHYNCAGSVTYWGTILSCEEHPPLGADSLGFVIEVYPTQPETWTRRTGMGRFSHESTLEDPLTGDYYLTDDSATGVFFKFVPFYPGYLGRGHLFALNETTGEWIRVTDMLQTEQQAITLGATTHPRLEGLAYNPIDDAIYIMVTGVYGNPGSTMGYILRFDPRTQTMIRWLDGNGYDFANPDNVEIDACGNLIIQEDKFPDYIAEFGPNRVVLIAPDRSVTPILRGLDDLGEPSGLTFGASEQRFWLSWMHGASGSELIEVRMPPAWNCEATAVPIAVPAAASLPHLQAAPNPFAAFTWLHGRVPPGERVRLDIYDARGAHWRTLVNGPVASGELAVVWDGRDHRHRRAPRGYYFAKLSAGERSTAARIVLMR